MSRRFIFLLAAVVTVVESLDTQSETSATLRACFFRFFFSIFPVNFSCDFPLAFCDVNFWRLRYLQCAKRSSIYVRMQAYDYDSDFISYRDTHGS